MNTGQGPPNFTGLIKMLTLLTDIVTCISLDADGSHLISGSADLTCAVWKIEQVNGFSAGLSRKPIQLLYGHDSCITAVGMHGDLDMAVSGAKVTLSFNRKFLMGSNFLNTNESICEGVEKK